MESLLGIGELARVSGLSVSALRFYDGAGVLRPADVDPRTGYRRYRRDQVRDARLIARLRRVGMPLAEVCRLLDPALPTDEAAALLDAHLRRLEAGLTDARRELSAVRTVLDRSGDPMILTLPATAFDAVRYAVGGADPEHAVLGCVLVERDADGGRLAATDRYRLAVAGMPVPAGEPVAVPVPVGLLDDIRPALTGGEMSLRMDGETVTVTAGGRTATGVRPAADFPDWRSLGRAASPHRVDLDVPAFRAALTAAPAESRVRDQDGTPYEMVVLAVGPDGALAIAGEDGLRVAVNRDFLLDALGTGDQLVLELDTPITPLALRVPDAAAYALLMPVRL